LVLEEEIPEECFQPLGTTFDGFEVAWRRSTSFLDLWVGAWNACLGAVCA
jgi:hypothetical protein